MTLLIPMLIVTFIMFGKNIVIAYNAVVSTEDRVKSVTYFSLFVLFCGAMVLILKWAYKPLALISFIVVGCWLGKKVQKKLEPVKTAKCSCCNHEYDI